MTESTWRSYTIRFDGRPTIKEIQDELTNAAKSMNAYTKVAIYRTCDSTDPNLEEISFTMEVQR